MESFPGHHPQSILEATKSPKAGSRPERRKRIRAQVHWQVVFANKGAANSGVIVTQDLSSTGFYCITTEIFVTGQTLACTLTVPVHHRLGVEPGLALQCTVQVVRAEPVGNEGLHGVAFRIENYSLSRQDA